MAYSIMHKTRNDDEAHQGQSLASALNNILLIRYSVYICIINQVQLLFYTI